MFSRARALFSLEPEHPEPEETRLSAAGPALTLAARAIKGGSARAEAAAVWFREKEPERFRKLEAAAK